MVWGGVVGDPSRDRSWARVHEWVLLAAGVALVNETAMSLRAQTRLNEIDRQLSSNRSRLAAMKWAGAPVMVLMVGYAAGSSIQTGWGLRRACSLGVGES